MVSLMVLSGLNKGYTTLNAMKRGGYATDPNWVAKISSVANSSIVYL